MKSHAHFELIRMQAAATANAEDARIWRWYADLMEDRRLVCLRCGLAWTVTVDGRLLARDPSFDLAVRTAYLHSHVPASLNPAMAT
ncbi:hypothetical protein LMG29542_07472 [Paraburkholderia humisilvae]|uniref:Uncharacterized protein n=1 Tax=Paraburkholderia humisilvae TaxID=627669 RepID=A0A6J5F9J2_9BURK|nr:hypothetical protein LMG29542_07472 [Paraburkholderia humisilvae]